MEGRRHQVAARLRHGIQYQSPVLPRVESAEQWETHLAGIRESLDPVGTLEEAFVHKIAFQLWRVDRLIRHETGIVSSKISNPRVDFGEAERRRSGRCSPRASSNWRANSKLTGN